MSILSLNYLLFAAATFLLYYLCPLKKRWVVLLIASVVHYAFAGWQSAVYLMAISCITYIGAWAVQRAQSRKRQKLVLTCTVVPVLCGMAFIKYGGLWGAQLLIPLGLSWFTFQSVGYVVDVYRGKVQPEKNPFKYLLFLSFFPQLAQGPISSFESLRPQLVTGHRLAPEGVAQGVLLILWGYFKKLVIADRLAFVTAYVTGTAGLPGWMVLLGALVYMLRLYADFSGGMDVILGISKMLGVELTANFKRPFFAKTVSDYWRRWHISLGAWFRSYLLYPLTTSRFGLALGKGAVRIMGKKTGRVIPSALATLIIFFLIGIWHGASLNAALYGLYFGLVMCGAMLLEPVFRKARKRLKLNVKNPFWQAFMLCRTWLIVLNAQFFAFSLSSAQAFSLMGGVFRAWGSAGVSATLLGAMPQFEWVVAIAALAVLLCVDVLSERGVSLSKRLSSGAFLPRLVVMLALIVAIVVFGVYGEGLGSSAFLYTQF